MTFLRCLANQKLNLRGRLESCKANEFQSRKVICCLIGWEVCVPNDGTGSGFQRLGRSLFFSKVGSSQDRPLCFFHEWFAELAFWPGHKKKYIFSVVVDYVPFAFWGCVLPTGGATLFEFPPNLLRILLNSVLNSRLKNAYTIGLTALLTPTMYE